MCIFDALNSGGRISGVNIRARISAGAELSY